MRISLVTLAACLSAASSAAPPPNGGAVHRSPAPASAAGPCRFDDLRRHATTATAQARRLGELPAGNLELAVLREEGGCMTPVIVRYGIGGPSGR